MAGVSHTTVSRALNGNPLIKKETRERIARIAAEMNYVPNYSARNLVTKKSHSIGLFFSSIDHGTSNNFLVDAIKSINHVLSEDYNLIISAIDSIRNLENVQPWRYDGILIMSQSDEDNSFIYHIQSKGIPCIVLNRQLDDPNVVNVTAHDREGVQKVVDQIITLGHRRIAIIEGKAGFKSTSERRQGFIDSLLQHQIPFHSHYAVSGDYSMESGFEAMNILLDLENPPTAVFCSNDDMAIGAMNACYARGVQVPTDISIIGFDDIMFAKYTNPSLTTIRKPISEICETGAALLLELMNGKQPVHHQLFVETELIQRNSLAKLT